MYEKMVGLCQVDQQLYKAQRMGLISFYMTSYGEEATHFGSAAALHEKDMVYAQYREPGVLLWRGFSLDQMVDQCFNNRHDLAHGRQMPVHYGSPEHYFQFISSPLATQMPQAPGYAHGLKQAGSDNCVIVYFGDGAAQEGDAHAAMNFAATLKCPVIFFCRNNGYAISTPVEENYKGDGLAQRALGYGMEGYRVDGNDVLAVYNVTKKARELVVDEGAPVLIEAMTYRLGSHSTSDDQTGYQDMSEVKDWRERYFPRDRLRGYLQSQGLWDQEKEDELVSVTNETIRSAIKRARAEKKPSLEHMFTDVYDVPPLRLRRQKEEVQAMVAKYPEHFPTASHE
ncbi:2-oxoisovalerate dehydrogenase subunit alpha, mitochondrial [Geodia barretti]|nr:2-oxoisovalerate dehydrogenase subunit alpha, mitochondrial [Geodia barretti]